MTPPACRGSLKLWPLERVGAIQYSGATVSIISRL